MVLNLLFVAGCILGFWLFLVLVGLALTLACLPQHRRRFAIVLSPIVAMTLITGVTEHWIFLLLQPYRPIAVYAFVVGFSVAVLVVKLWMQCESPMAFWRSSKVAVRTGLPYLAVPFLAVMLFACFFAINGLEMLSAGEDELGYVEVASHIIGHLYTHDAFDYPWARGDHYLGDVVARTNSYIPDARLGAFFLLADLSRLLHVSVERAFPLTVGAGIATATASLSLVALLVRRSRIAIIAAQLIFASSWLLVMLHFQGSLSHVMSYPVRLGGLAFIFWSVIFARRPVQILLSAVLVAGWLVLYHESIGLGFALPLVAGFIAILWRARRRGFETVRRYALRSVALAVFACALQPQLAWDVFDRQLDYIRSNVGLNEPPASFTGTLATIANSIPPILGYSSLYDDSGFNYSIITLLHPYVAVLLIGLCMVGAIGFLRRLPSGAAGGWAMLTIALPAITVMAARHENYVLMIRSAQMAIPNIVLGLSLLTFAQRPSLQILSGGLCKTWPFVAERMSAGAVWFAFLALNAISVVDTISYVNRYSQESDARVRHFDPDRPVWAELRMLVEREDQSPVLISGFTNTPTPHIIVHGLRSIPHLLGRSITSFWPGADPAVSLPKDFRSPQHWLTSATAKQHWLTRAELEARLKEDPVSNWQVEYARLLARTRIALVPPFGAYPVEWGEWTSLFGVKAWRFSNLCDALERNSPTFIPDAELVMTGRDASGPYWIITGEVRARANLSERTRAFIEVRYEGPAPQVQVDGAMLKGYSRVGINPETMILSILVNVRPDATVSVLGGPNTRLRSVELYRLPGNVAGDR